MNKWIKKEIIHTTLYPAKLLHDLQQTLCMTIRMPMSNRAVAKAFRASSSSGFKLLLFVESNVMNKTKTKARMGLIWEHLRSTNLKGVPTDIAPQVPHVSHQLGSSTKWEITIPTSDNFGTLPLWYCIDNKMLSGERPCGTIRSFNSLGAGHRERHFHYRNPKLLLYQAGTMQESKKHRLFKPRIKEIRKKCVHAKKDKSRSEN